MRALSLRLSLAVVVAAAVAGCAEDEPATPFVTALNEPVDYAHVGAEHLTAYVDAVVSQASEQAAAVEAEESVTFESIIRPFDAMVSALAKAGNKHEHRHSRPRSR